MQISQLDKRCYTLLKELLQSDGYLEIDNLAAKHNISKRSVYYDIAKVNECLQANKIDPILLDRGQGIHLNKKQNQQVAALFKAQPVASTILFSPMERVKLILCWIVLKEEVLNIETFQQLCNVSRNTTINDLKSVAAFMKDYSLDLIYASKKGYVMEGELIKQRALFFSHFPSVAQQYMEQCTMEEFSEVHEHRKTLQYIESTLDTKYVEETLQTLAVYLPVLLRNTTEITFEGVHQDNVTSSYEFELVSRSFPTLMESDRIYVTLHLLGSRLQSLPFSITNELEDKEPYEYAKALVAEFSRIACMQFQQKKELEQSLFVHLKSSLYRYRYGIRIENPFLEDIRIQYPELFELTKKASEYLNQQLGSPIHDSEIAYLTLHFGSFLSANKEDQAMNILIVCPNGISTGNMLKGEVGALVPNATSIKVVALSEWENLQDDYQVIFSTVDLDNDKSILVHPILSDMDRITILKACMTSTKQMMYGADELYYVVEKYLDETKKEAAKQDIKKFLSSHTQVKYPPLGASNKGMSYYLTKQHVQILQGQWEWKDAIKRSAAPLIDDMLIESRYVDAIIDQTRKLGPYMFITNDVVLAHAKSADGVIDLGLSVAFFQQEVLFPKQRSAKIIIVLGAKDQVKHLKILKDIMVIFSNPNNAVLLNNMDSVEEILEEIKQFTRRT